MFSQLVDRAVHVAGRPDALVDMAYHANETMRDISKRHEWDDDACEVSIPVLDLNAPTLWVPEEGMTRFRREEFIEYDTGCEPTRVKPSRRIRDLKEYYYRVKDTFVFVGAKAEIRVFYYAYQPWLKYYPDNSAPTTFLGGPDDEWSDPTQSQIDLVSNWMLLRHNECVLAGTLARFFASKSDPRQQVHYSQAEQRISHMIRSEGVDQLLGNRRG